MTGLGPTTRVGRGGLQRPPTLTKEEQARFFAQIRREGACAIWTGKTTSTGQQVYPRFWVKARAVGFLAHRIAVVLAGRFSWETRLAKTCTTPLCVEPTHFADARDRNGDGTKRCRLCRENKSRSEFTPKKFRGGTVPSWACRVCLNWYQRLRKYKISKADFLAKQRAQRGACGICRCALSQFGPRQVAIDHDHATGKVRGILCHACNHLLGNARDDEKVLQAAIQYLRRSK
jgi:hypothetical protein